MRKKGNILKRVGVIAVSLSWILVESSKLYAVAAWTSPVNLSDTETGVSNQLTVSFPPQLAVALDPDAGNFQAAVTWEGIDASIQVVKVRPFHSLSDLVPDPIITIPASAGSQFPAVAIDDKNNYLTTYEISNIQDAQSSLNGAAGISVINGVGNLYYPRVALNNISSPTASINAAFVVQNSGTNTIKAFVSANKGASWGVVANLTSVESYYPKVGLDSSGNAIAVWQEKVSPYTTYASRTTGPAGAPAWSAKEIISSTTIDNQDPQLSVAPSGLAMSIWWQNAPTSAGTIRTNYFNGTSWGSEESSISPSMKLAKFPNVAINDNGRAVAVWIIAGDTGSTSTIQVSQFNGTSWSSQPKTLSQFTTTDATSDNRVQICTNINNQAVAVWTANVNGFAVIQAAMFNGSRWSSVQNLSPAGQNSLYPQVGINNDGIAYATWQTSTGTNSFIVQGSSYQFSPDPDPPHPEFTGSKQYPRVSW